MKTHRLTRRQMIALTAAAASLGFAPHLAPLLADAKSRGFKIGACEWSLRKSDPSSMDLAKQIGIDGVQVTMGNVENNLHLRKPEVQQAYLDAAKHNGIEVSSIGIAVINQVPLKNDPHAIEWLVDSIAVAQALKVKVILIAQFGNGNLKGDKPGIDRTVEILKEHVSKAEQAGVIWGLENLLSAEENLDILDRVGSPAVQIYYDVGNSTDQGYDIYKEIRMIKGRVCEFHAKDGKFMLGAGRVDFKKVREAIDEIDYRGWIQIEAAAPTNLITDYQDNLALLKTHFPLAA